MRVNNNDEGKNEHDRPNLSKYTLRLQASPTLLYFDRTADIANKIRIKPALDASVSVMSISDKHECDRGIYTIHKSASNTTPPIKLKRPTVITTVSRFLCSC